MTQQSHYQAHNLRKPQFQCSLQHCLQWPAHGSNLDVHQQMNGQRRYGICWAVLSHSVVSDFVTHGLQPTRLLCPWGFCRQEYWSGQLIPSPGTLPDPGIEPGSPALQVDSLPAELLEKPIVHIYNEMLLSHKKEQI